LHSFLVVDRFDATAMKMESGRNSCQRSLHPIGQIYRILVGVVCKFCVVFARAPARALRREVGTALALNPDRDAFGRFDAPGERQIADNGQPPASCSLQ